MKSWDCWETLITKKSITDERIFEKIGKSINDPNFVDKRILARIESKRTGKPIYDFLDIDPNYEFETVLDESFPIQENMNQIKDGDYIISDYWMDESKLSLILNKCGLNKKVKLIVTPQGKRSGYIWNTLNEKPSLHIGDNKLTDYDSPKKYGIDALIDNKHELTDIEKYVFKIDEGLACFMRMHRLLCPYISKSKEARLWKDQSEYNIPILILTSLELENKNITHFSLRDCKHLHRIYDKLIKKPYKIFYSSRKLYRSKSSSYKKYLDKRGINEESVIVDIYGSGYSPNIFFGGKIPFLWYITGSPRKKPLIDNPKAKRLIEIENGRSVIEKHNVPGEEGSAIDCDIDGNIIHAENEYREYIGRVQKEAVDKALEIINQFEYKPNINLIKYMINKMKGNETDKIVPMMK